MVLHVVGLGLGTEQDITLRGLAAIKKCKKVYLEAYTSILTVPKEKLEELYGVAIEIAHRELCESGIEPIIERARTEDVAMLVVGDPFGATTHCDLLARAKELGVPTNVVHNASIMNAVGCTGLQLYRFGETISLCFFTSTWRPDSYYDKLARNASLGLHTLALLDIKVREPTIPSLARGRPVHQPPRFMSVRQAVQQLRELEEKRGLGVATAETRAVGVARVGCDDQLLVHGTLEQLLVVDWGAPLHSLVLLGTVGRDEEELLAAFCLDAAAAPTLDAAALAALDAAAQAASDAHEGIAPAPADDSEEDELVKEMVAIAREEGLNATAVGGGSGGGGGGALGLSDEEMKAKQESEAKKAKEKEALEKANAEKAATLEKSGKKVAGGMHKFDANEVDVNGGDATADDFLDAFGF